MNKFIPTECVDFPGYYLIPGYSNYACSEDGKIKLIRKTTDYRFKRATRFGQGPIKVPRLNNHGYFTVNVRSDSDIIFKTRSVHRLVCLAFYGLPEGDKNIVNHKDGNKQNNHYTNLEWCTYSLNNQHAYDSGIHGKNVPIKVWDILNDTINTFNSIAEFSRSIGNAETCIPRYWMYFDRVGLYLDRYCFKKLDDETPWPDKKLLLGHRIVLKNLKSGEEIIVNSYTAAGNIIGITYGAVKRSLLRHKQYFEKYWLAKFLFDETPWLNIDEYNALSSRIPKDIIFIDSKTKKITIASSILAMESIINISGYKLRVACNGSGILKDGSICKYLDHYLAE
jgi:hypothetical protein